MSSVLVPLAFIAGVAAGYMIARADSKLAEACNELDEALREKLVK